MELFTQIVGYLGGAGTMIGLFGIWTGWQDFSTGKINENAMQQSKGQNAMIFGGLTAAVSASIAAAVIAQMSGIIG
ncbi:hypothetical protein [Streptococcus ovis]|uniref:hypothetical protein n=1 Tax=Streptococcus ovis TaxID=82806 RepID=UPI00036C1568|nr:hypothetical protein [Streptococcus ovis]